MANNELNKSVRELLFAVRRSSRYHHARRRFFDRNNTLTNAVTLIFGSAAIYTVLQLADRPLITILMAAAVSIASVADLVVGNSKKARLHHDLARDFIDLESQIVRVENPTRADFEHWTARRLVIEASEPPVKEVLNLLMHNKVSLAMGPPRDGRDIDETLYYVNPLRRVLAQYMDVFSDSIDTVQKKKEKKLQRKQPKLNPA